MNTVFLISVLSNLFHHLGEGGGGGGGGALRLLYISKSGSDALGVDQSS